MKTKLLSYALLSASLIAGCGEAQQDNNPTPTPDMSQPAVSKDIVDTAVAAGKFGTLVTAVKTAGLESTLRGAGPFTVFAPDDGAFGKVPEFLRTQLLSAPYKTELSLILTYHVVAGNVKAAGLLGKTQDVATAAPGGAKVKVDGSNGKVVLNGGVNVTTADVTASNGTIHVVDRVLLPSIVDTAVGYKDGATEFKTLVTAVTAADLGATLSGPGTFTVFAPTDAAFAALKASLGDTKWNALLADKVKLARVLKYHVLGSVAFAKDVKSGQVDTLAGATDKLTLSVAAGQVTVTDAATPAGGKPASVVLADLPTSNGVIHVIDRVLVPANLGL
ncbi:MAG: fasciclin domain-containing protein [Polyangia bacterium]